MRDTNSTKRVTSWWASATIVILTQTISLTMVVHAEDAVWSSGGPYTEAVGGDVRSLIVHPTATERLCAGLNVGDSSYVLQPAIFQTDTGGDGWVATLQDQTISYVIFGAFAFDPTSPGTLYAGTDSSWPIYESKDFGRTWFHVSSARALGKVNALVITSSPPAIKLYAGTSKGVFKSIDTGDTFTAANTGLTELNVTALAASPASQDTIYAGTKGGGVFKSTNSGGTWSAVNSGLTDLTVSALAIAPSGMTLYAATGSGVFRSTDAGTTWGPANTGLTKLAVALLINPQTPSILYAGTSGGLFKSTSSGDVWTAANTGLTDLRVNVLAINPSSPGTLYAGTANGVFRSLDGGITWKKRGVQAERAGAMAINPLTPSTLVSGMFKSTDYGNNWKRSALSKDPASLAFSPVAPFPLYAATEQGLLQSSDSGDTWRTTGLTSPVSVVAIDPSSPSTIYANGNGVLKSTDAGNTWSTSNSGLTNLAVASLALDPTAPSTLYVGTGEPTTGGGVYKSTDAGKTWSRTFPVNTVAAVTGLAISPSSPSTIYAGTQGRTGGGQNFGGQVFKSVDAGKTWTSASGELGLIYALAVDPTDSETIYVDYGVTAYSPYRTQHYFMKSTDGGRKWVDAGLPNVSVANLSFTSTAPAVLYASTSNGVWKLAKSDAPLSLSRGRVRVTVDWKSQYTGETGTAHAIPKKDEFGFFYFTDPNNPEVFVKVLDFGSGKALCFVGGLSDFYYKVTFTSLSNGSTLVFEKAAGDLGGFADGQSLPFEVGEPPRPTAASSVASASLSQVGTLDLRSNGSGIAANPEQYADTNLSERASTPQATAPQELLLTNGRVRVTVDWQSQYSGTSGRAFAIPQADSFGFLYFTDPNNPEVFVKVLDFGAGNVLCFVGGLSDFYYKVTFTTVRTGQTLVFEKKAGDLIGFANGSGLQF